MSDPLSAGISAFGSLLGGVLGDSEDSWEASRNSIFGMAEGARRAGAKYGFNPLTLLQRAAPVAGDNTNHMGAALADAAMFAADAFLKKGNADALQLNQYQCENEVLQDRLTALTLRPIEPGVYQRGENGSVSGGSGGSDAGMGGANDGVASVASTQTTYTTPGVEAETTVPEGVDAEDIATGLALEGINEAKAQGSIPQKWEEPFWRFGRNIARKSVIALDRVHNGIYDLTHGTRVRESDAVNEEMWTNYWLDKNPHFLMKNGGADFRKFLKTAPKRVYQ